MIDATKAGRYGVTGGSGRLDALVLGSRSAGSEFGLVCMGF
jgi:hypothetical protein